MIDRRRLLGGSLGLAAGALLPGRALGVGAEIARPGLFASVAKDDTGKFIATVFEADTGKEQARVQLPSRGHDLTQRPRRAGEPAELVAFARRPGNFAVVFHPEAKTRPRWLTSREDRHFYGHGVFSPDGRLLFTTENDYENGKGVIGVRDATAGYRQIGEFTSGGIGPHDLAMLSDGHTLVVANGGILTHPDTPRLELNLADMDPCLAYIDARNGDVLATHRLAKDLHQLSIRHLTVGADDTVIFGAQFRGPRYEIHPIVGRHRKGDSVALLALPEKITGAMRNYVASLDSDAAGETAIISAPRGGLAIVVEVRSGRYLGRYELEQVFGVARSTPATRTAAFVMTSGSGALAEAGLLSEGGVVSARPQAIAKAWDNHLLALA
ncbi:MAG: DUF1513 domain-containing protein [Hyphomicrobiaceae bacterium]